MFSLRSITTFGRTYLGSLACAGLIAYLSLIRESHIHLPSVAFADKWGHMLMYWVFAIVMVAESKRYLYAGLIAVLYGGAMELLQEYCFPPRTGEWMDWVADLVGVVAGLGLMLIWNKLRPSKPQPHD